MKNEQKLITMIKSIIPIMFSKEYQERDKDKIVTLSIKIKKLLK